MPLNYWPSTPNKLPSRTLRKFRGVNKLDPYSIDDSFSPKVKNISSSKVPAMTIRPGFTLLGSQLPGRIIGLDSWKNGELHAVSLGSWYKWNGSSWTLLKSGFSVGAEWAFTNFKGNMSGVNLVGANGSDPVQRYDGTTVQSLANAPSKLAFIDQHDNRLYGATNNTVYFSGLNLADSWTLVGSPNDSSPGQIVRETNDGENIIGLKSSAGHVTVFFPNSMHELYGTSPSDFEFLWVAGDFGALNDQSITNLGGAVYFLDETGIYNYAGGSRPSKDLSKPVQWYVDNMNKNLKPTACMGSDGRYLYVAIPMGTGSSADTILVYDSIEQIWDVWEDLKATRICKMGDDLYMGDALGRIMKIGGTTDNGAAISWEWQSKPFAGQSMMQKMRWTRLWLIADKPDGSTMNIYMTKEPEADSGWVFVGSVNDVGIQGKPIYINPSAVGVANWLRLKITGIGPCTIREISWDEIQSSVV